MNLLSKRRRLLLSSKKKHTVCNWVCGNFTIDDYIMNAKGRCVIKGTLAKTTTGQHHVLRARKNLSGTFIDLYFQRPTGTGQYWVLAYQSSYTATSTVQIATQYAPPSSSNTFDIDLKERKVSVSNASYNVSIYNSGTAVEGFAVLSEIKVESLKLYDNGTLTHELVPCHDGDDVYLLNTLDGTEYHSSEQGTWG